MGDHHDIELGVANVRRPSIFSIESGIGNEGIQATEQTMPPVHLNVSQPSVEAIIAIIALGSTIMVGLLGLNFPINGDDSKHSPTALFRQHPMSLCFFVVIGVATFYFTAIGTILCRFRPNIARTLNLIALVLVVLAVTVLLWALLPNKFGWVPWIFFAATILAASVVQAWEWATQKSTDKIPCFYRDHFWCPTIHSPSVIIRNSSHQLLLNSWQCSPRLRRVRSSSL
ncbi:uncharacterized protein LOC131258031 [Magnolia sinica]|uniref:uncharacterized protein LOC131258031 n=1 Tax=Magnolia sinica TaxID=86752 RepID=UPI00265B1CDC|nr:uncharacterized protein LOC131258031 [Magnolia sinica]